MHFLLSLGTGLTFPPRHTGEWCFNIDGLDAIVLVRIFVEQVGAAARPHLATYSQWNCTLLSLLKNWRLYALFLCGCRLGQHC